MLLLAIPIQGFAAATMLLCKSGHHSEISSSQNHDEHQAHSASAHVLDDSPSHAASPEHPKACSACSVCCNLSVLLPFFEWPGTIAESQSSIAFMGGQPHGLLLEGIKKPPRLPLA
jgi:hypothetical protein